jgi:hypothetical protein
MAPRQRSAAAASGSAPHERWSVTVEGDAARLDVPADAQRERRFEVYCCFTVAHPGGGAASHALRVLVDGQQEWARRIATDAGGRDTLDVRFRRSVPPGRALRLQALGSTEGARPLRLSIEVEEE